MADYKKTTRNMSLNCGYEAYIESDYANEVLTYKIMASDREREDELSVILAIFLPS